MKEGKRVMGTVRDTLYYETEADRYVKIYDGGWLVAMCYIDDEDLWCKYMDEDLLDRKVKSKALVNDKDFNKMIYRVDI